MPVIGDIKIRIGGNIKSLEKSLKNAERSLKRSGERMAAMGDRITSSITLAVGGAGYAAIKVAGDIESLEKGMVSMMGSAEDAKEEIALLRKEALKPGLNFQQALKGSIRLQAVKVDADTARRALSGFGNAIALVGGTGEQLEGVTLALSQIAAKGKISAEEINQLAERVPQIRQLLNDAFGTADTEVLQKRGIGFEEFISKIIVELEKMPKAQGGIKNSLENMQLAFQETAAAIGQQLFPIFNRLAGATLKVITAFTSLSPTLQDNIIKFALVAAAAGPLLKIFGALKILAGSLAGSLLKSVGTIKAAFLALTGPLGLVVLAISAIGFAIVADIGGARKTLVSVINYFITLYNKSTLFRGALAAIAFQFKSLYAIGKGFFNVLIDGLKVTGKTIAALLTGDFGEIKTILSEGWEQAKNDGVNAMEDVSDAWKTGFENTFNQRKPISLITEADVDNTINKASEALKGIEKRIKDTFSGGIGGNSPSPSAAQTSEADTKRPQISAFSPLPSVLKEIAPVGDSVNKVMESMKGHVERANESFQKIKSTWVDTVGQFKEGVAQILESGIEDGLSNIGETLGNVIGGSADKINILGSVLASFANIMIQVGKLAITTGAAIGGIKKALQSLNPVAAIAAGVALVALGSVVKGKAQSLSAPKLAKGGLAYGETLAVVGDNPNASINPEVIAPLDKLQEMIKNAIPAPLQNISVAPSNNNPSPLDKLKEIIQNIIPAPLQDISVAPLSDNQSIPKNSDITTPLDKLQEIIKNIIPAPLQGNIVPKLKNNQLQPNNQLQNIETQNQKIELGGEFAIKGNDLVMLVERVINQRKRFGIG